VDVTDNVAAAAFPLIVTAAGTVTANITVLPTAEDVGTRVP
jgi:hypothetical protein